MRAIRRPLASCALALLILQFGLLIGAPVSACCGAPPARAAAPRCCTVGTHTPSPCPMHARPERSSADCRMTCANAHGMQLLVGAFGILPAPAVSAVTFSVRAVDPLRQLFLLSRISTPDTPPPESRA